MTLRAIGSLSTPGKLALLGSLYFSQGLPFGFFTQSLPVIMRKEGMSLGDIGLASLLAIPWALKFLWAPAVDRFGSRRFGRRKSFIVPLQLLSMLVLTGLAALFVDDGLGSLPVLLGGVFVINLVSATQDIATDGLAVDALAQHERGLANGLQVAGYRVGTSDSRPKPAEAASYYAFFRRPGAGRILLVIATYKVGDALAQGMLRPFYADLGLSLSELGWMLGAVGFVAGLIGAIAGGALVNRLGRRASLITFGVLQAVAVAGYALIALLVPADRLALHAATAFEHFAGGMATAALFTCMMDWCDPASSATDYTIQASTVVITTGLAAAVSGYLAEALGYTAHFGLATALSLAGLFLVFVIFPSALASQPVKVRAHGAASGSTRRERSTIST